MRGHSLVLSTILVLSVVAAPPARAVGVIETAGATIDSGPGPTKGAVTIDPAAPVGIVPTLPMIDGPGAPPSLTGSMPPLPSFGDGTEGAFSAGGGGPVPVLLPGTHQFTSFTVTNGATVPITGATTILVTGDVSIAGVVGSAAAGASITFRCGGDFTLVSRNPGSLVQTTMATSPIEIVAGGKVAIGTDVNNLDAQVAATSSDVTLTAHGTTGTASGVSVKSGRIQATAGAVTIRTNAEFSMGGIVSTRPGRVDCAGPLLIQSFADRVVSNSSGDFTVTAGPATFEAATQLIAGGDIALTGSFPLTFAAVAGSMDFYGAISTADGELTARCGGDVNFYSGSVSSAGTGNVSFAAGGRVEMNSAVAAEAGDVDIVSAGDVRLRSSITTQANARIRVSGGEFHMLGFAVLTAGTASIRATGTIDIGELDVEGIAKGPKAATRGSEVLLSADQVDIAGGADVTVDAANATALTGSFDVLAQGPITVARVISSATGVSLRSIAGDVDVVDATLRTFGEAVTTGAVAVETWKAGGRIDAANASITSGGAETTSGAVSVLVHDPGPPVVVESFILPKKLSVKVDAGRPAKNSLTAAGFFDTGPAAIDLTQPATIRVGSRQFDVPGFVADRKGRKFTHTAAGLTALIVPNPNGSSRAKFRVLASGDALTGAVPLDGDATLSFEFGAIDGIGTVRLTAGQFKLGKKRGALVAPGLFPVRARAKLAGQGKDALSLIVGLATNGLTPAAAPSVHVDFGTGFSLDVASGDFVRKGDRFIAPGVVLDFKRETIAVSAKKTFLGPGFVAGPQPVSVKVLLGNDSREVRVRMVRNGTTLFY